MKGRWGQERISLKVTLTAVCVVREIMHNKREM